MIWKTHIANVAIKIVIIMGDMIAKVGSEQDPLKEIVGGHGLG